MPSFKILLRFRCLSLVSWLCTYLLNSGYNSQTVRQGADPAAGHEGAPDTPVKIHAARDHVHMGQFESPWPYQYAFTLGCLPVKSIYRI